MLDAAVFRSLCDGLRGKADLDTFDYADAIAGPDGIDGKAQMAT